MNLQDIASKATFIDVREELELLTDGKLDHALHIPLGEIEERIEEIRELPKPIILFCRSGNRSGRAIEFLQENGIEELYNGGGYVDVKELF